MGLMDTIPIFGCCSIDRYYSMMKPLAELDPLTLQALVYVCPDRDLSKLLLWIPPNVSTAWLSFLLTILQYRVITVDEVRHENMCV